MTTSSLAAAYYVERAFQGAEPKRKADMICDITKAIDAKKETSDSPRKISDFPNIIFFNKPKEYVKLEKLQHDLKVSTIALIVTSAALFILGFVACFFIPLPISAWVLGSAIMLSATLFTVACATGFAHLGKQAQYRREVNKAAEYIQAQRPVLEQQLKII